MFKDVQILNNVYRISDRDSFLLSYPRSGNTWLRLLLSDIYFQLMNYDTRGTRFLVGKFGSVSPALETHDVNTMPRPDLGIFLIKTHIKEASDVHRFVYIYRRPEESIASYYKFLKQRTKGFDGGDFEKFFIEQLKEWQAHATHAIKNRGNGFFIDYADLVENTLEVLMSLREFISLNYEMSHATKALRTRPSLGERAQAELLKPQLIEYAQELVGATFGELCSLSGNSTSGSLKV